MVAFVIRLLINAAALWAAARFVDGLALTGGFTDVLIVALIFGAVNAIIKPVVRFFSFPLIILTLGLATLVINAGMLWLTSLLTPHLRVDGFMPALFGAIVVSLVSWVLSVTLPDDSDDD